MQQHKQLPQKRTVSVYLLDEEEQYEEQEFIKISKKRPRIESKKYRDIQMIHLDSE